MASVTAKIDRYKLDSTFDEESVFHTTRLLPGPRMGALKTHWKRDKKLGAGAFGVVWREKEHKTGQLRAVKVISKLQLNVREVEALVEIQNVRPHARIDSAAAKSCLASEVLCLIPGLVRRSTLDPHRDGVYCPW